MQKTTEREIRAAARELTLNLMDSLSWRMKKQRGELSRLVRVPQEGTNLCNSVKNQT